VPMSALTIQRGPGNRGGQQSGQGNRTPGATPTAPATSTPAAPAPPRSPGTSSIPAGSFKTAQASSAEGERPRMSREAFQNMSEEERARFREQRRKAREQAQDTGNVENANAATPGAETPQRPTSGANANTRAATRAASAGSKNVTTPSAPNVSSGIPRGEGASRAQRGPRMAKVKVMAADGSIEERDITIGISNRVHAEVLSGLKEGDRVIAGTRESDTPRRPTAQQGMGQPTMGGPGGMPGGAAAGARR
jgi:macrolide-specific efflux system membrane fusion protein